MIYCFAPLNKEAKCRYLSQNHKMCTKFNQALNIAVFPYKGVVLSCDECKNKVTDDMNEKYQPITHVYAYGRDLLKSEPLWPQLIKEGKLKSAPIPKMSTVIWNFILVGLGLRK